MAGHMADVPGEICTGSRRTKVSDHFAGSYHERGDQRPRAVPDILKLSLLGMVGSSRLRRMLALQNLHARLLVAADDQTSLLVQTRSVQVQSTDGLSLGVEIRIVTVEP